MTKTGLTDIPQPTSWSYDPKSGFKTTLTRKFTTVSERETFESTLRGGGWAYSVNAELDDGVSGLWTVTATRGGNPNQGTGDGGGDDVNEPLSDSWEMSSNLLEKDLLESDHGLMASLWTECPALTSSFTPPKTPAQVFTFYVENLKAFANNPTTGGVAFFAPAASAFKLANLIVAGVKSTRIFQPTLRHNKIVSDKYSVQDALTNCGSIIKASSIAALEGIPTTILFNLPDAYASARSDDFGALLKYGWFKKYPNVTELADDQWQISQEFEWGLWHENLYTFV